MTTNAEAIARRWYDAGAREARQKLIDRANEAHVVLRDDPVKLRFPGVLHKGETVKECPNPGCFAIACLLFAGEQDMEGT